MLSTYNLHIQYLRNITTHNMCLIRFDMQHPSYIYAEPLSHKFSDMYTSTFGYLPPYTQYL